MMLKTLGVIVIFLLMLTAGCSKTSQPNIILIIVDTLRADHLGCYGYHRDTSPTIDRLAATGTLWEEVQAQSSWTLPAITSIFTGVSMVLVVRMISFME